MSHLRAASAKFTLTQLKYRSSNVTSLHYFASLHQTAAVRSAGASSVCEPDPHASVSELSVTLVDLSGSLLDFDKDIGETFAEHIDKSSSRPSDGKVNHIVTIENKSSGDV